MSEYYVVAMPDRPAIALEIANLLKFHLIWDIAAAAT